jgi:catalase
MSEPSTAWKEVAAEGEAQRLEQLAEALAGMQTGLFTKYGKGRALHRKAQGILRARLDVDGDLPAPARHGIFASKKSFDVVVRLSNASALLQKDATGDIRGFAWKVLGVDGPGALGSPTTSQDFLCINQETFGAKDAGEFVELAIAAAKGPGPLLGHLFKAHGFGAFRKLKQLAATVNRPFTGFFTETFSTVLPVACGPYAIRVRVVPRATQTTKPASWSEDVKERLAQADVVFETQVQFFVDEQRTPIEDASVPWLESAAPWTKVGTLTVLQQKLDDADGAKRQQEGEQLRFDPWNALVEHRPLGHIMRARKAAYYASQKARGVA